MARGGGKITGRTTIPAKDAFGSGEELERRLEDGYPSTESHFSQIRPRENVSPGGRSFNDKNGTGQGAHGPVERNGDFGAGANRRGEG